MRKVHATMQKAGEKSTWVYLYQKLIIKKARTCHPGGGRSKATMEMSDEKRKKNNNNNSIALLYY